MTAIIITLIICYFLYKVMKNPEITKKDVTKLVEDSVQTTVKEMNKEFLKYDIIRQESVLTNDTVREQKAYNEYKHSIENYDKFIKTEFEKFKETENI